MSYAGSPKGSARNFKPRNVKCFHFDPVTGQPEDGHDMNSGSCRFAHPIDGHAWVTAKTSRGGPKRSSLEDTQDAGWRGRSSESSKKGFSPPRRSRSPLPRRSRSPPRRPRHHSRSPPRGRSHSRSRTPPRFPSFHFRSSPPGNASWLPRPNSPPGPHSPVRSGGLPDRGSSPKWSNSPPWPGQRHRSPRPPSPPSRRSPPPKNRVPTAPRAFDLSLGDKQPIPRSSSKRKNSIGEEEVNRKTAPPGTTKYPTSTRKASYDSSMAPPETPSAAAKNGTKIISELSTAPSAIPPKTFPTEPNKVATNSTASRSQPSSSFSKLNSSESRSKWEPLVPIETSKNKEKEKGKEQGKEKEKEKDKDKDKDTEKGKDKDKDKDQGRHADIPISRNNSLTNPAAAGAKSEPPRKGSLTTPATTPESKERAMMDFIKLVVSLDAPITRIKEKQSELSRINDWLQRRGQSALDLSKIPEVVALREKIAEDAIFIQGRVMEAAKQNKIPIGDATDPAGAMSSQTSADLQTREALQDTVRNLNAKFDEVLQLRRIGRHPLQDQRDAEQKAFRDEVEGILANVRKELDELYERSADAEEMITEATTVLSEELHERFSQRLVKTREFGQSRVALEKDARELFTQVEKDTKVQQEEFRALVDRLSMLEKEKQELLKEEQEYKEILAKSTEDLGIMKNGLTALVQNRGAVISQSALSGGAKNKPMEHASTIGAVADDIVQNIVEQQLKPLLGRALQTAREEYDSQSEETLQKVVTSLAPTRELQKCLEEWHQSITMPPPASVRPPLAR